MNIGRWPSLKWRTTEKRQRLSFLSSEGYPKQLPSPARISKYLDVESGLTLRPPLVGSTTSFFAPQVTAEYDITVSLYTNPQSFFSPVVSESGQEITPSLFTNEQSFFAPTVQTSYLLSAPFFENTNVVFAPVVTQPAPAQELSPPLFSNLSAVFAPSVTSSYTLNPPEVINTSSFFGLVVSSVYDIQVSLFENENVFPLPHSIFFFLEAVQPPLYVNNSIFFAPTVLLEPERVTYKGNRIIDPKFTTGDQSNANSRKDAVAPASADGRTYRTPSIKQTTIYNAKYRPYGGEYEDDDLLYPEGSEIRQFFNGPDSRIVVSPIIDGGSFQRPEDPPVPPPVPPTKYYLLSTLFPAYYTEEVGLSATLVSGQLYTARYDMLPETVDLSADLDSGLLRTLLITYNNWPEEQISFDATLNSGLLETLLITYNNWPEEQISFDATLNSGLLETLLITYNNWPEEQINLDATLIGGSLA
jgi:hypothetical protein